MGRGSDCCRRGPGSGNAVDPPAVVAGLVWASGGPYCVPLVLCDDIPCPSCDPPPIPGLGDPNGVICFAGVPAGNWKITFRAEARGMSGGARVVALYRPDCADPSTEYLVRNFTLIELLEMVKLSCGNPEILVGELYVKKTNGANPGIRMLAFQGCDTPPSVLGPCRSGLMLHNVQVGFERAPDVRFDLTAPSLALSYAAPCPTCPPGPVLISQSPADGEAGVDVNSAIVLTFGSALAATLSLCTGSPVVSVAADQDPTQPCAPGVPISASTATAMVGPDFEVTVTPDVPLDPATRYSVRVCVQDDCLAQTTVAFCFVTA